MSHRLPNGNTYWVEPGRLMAGEYPGDPRPEVAHTRLCEYLDCGVDTFIDLTTRADGLEPYVEQASQEAMRRGIALLYESFPIANLDVPESPPAMARILDAIDLSLAAGRRVYVHCWGGIGRTGTVVGCYLARHGAGGGAALTRLAELWKGVAKSARRPRCPETRTQERFVLDWHEPPPAAVIRLGDCFYTGAAERELQARFPALVEALQVSGPAIACFELEPLDLEAEEPVALHVRVEAEAWEASRQVEASGLLRGRRCLLLAYTDITGARALFASRPPLASSSLAGYLGEYEAGLDLLAIDGTEVHSGDWDAARDYLERMRCP